MLKKLSAGVLSATLVIAPVSLVSTIAHAQGTQAPEPPAGATPNDNAGASGSGGGGSMSSGSSESGGSMSSGSGMSKHHMKKHKHKKHHHAM